MDIIHSDYQYVIEFLGIPYFISKDLHTSWDFPPFRRRSKVRASWAGADLASEKLRCRAFERSRR